MMSCKVEIDGGSIFRKRDTKEIEYGLHQPLPSTEQLENLLRENRRSEEVKDESGDWVRVLTIETDEDDFSKAILMSFGLHGFGKLFTVYIDDVHAKALIDVLKYLIRHRHDLIDEVNDDS